MAHERAHVALRMVVLGARKAVVHQQHRAAGQPRLTTVTRLFREGQLVLASPEEPFDAAGQADPARLSESRLFKLNEQAAPGEYALQITVNEIDPKGKRRTTTQWVDFEVVK